MSSNIIDPIISFKEITKRFTHHAVTSSKTFRDRINKMPREKSILALNQISLDIHKGDKIGFVGENGGGKSTLLKILCKVTPPSSGEIILNGKISAMLDVGTGFHKELSGQENILFNGSILGLKRKFIESKLPEIIQFSELSEFIHLPLKKYSSGMKMRLATSMAFFLDSDIIVFDEILNVGDQAFKDKCFEKMEALYNQSKTTIILVSHDLELLSRFCTRLIWLNQGRIKMDDKTAIVLNAYKN